MSSVTYHTKVPIDIVPFCEAMGNLFGNAERHLYKALERGENLNDLKRSYQKSFGINARQFNSIYSTIKGKIASRIECHKRQINELNERIKGLEKALHKRQR